MFNGSGLPLKALKEVIEMNKPRVRKLKSEDQAKKALGYEHEINITGNRDYRSPDIDIFTGVNAKDELSVMIPKTNRCYSFSHVEEEGGYVKIVFN